MSHPSNRYVVKEGDCLWTLSDRFLGSPSQWHRIYQYNNRESIIKMTGQGIKNPELIYPGQVLYMPILPNQPKPPRKKKRPIPKPKDLNVKIRQMKKPFAAAFDLREFPAMVYEDPFVKASVKLSGKIAIRLADHAPIIHATNRGLETTFTSQAENIVKDLFVKEAEIAWDNHTKKISYHCLLVSNSKGTNAPTTAVGLAIASDKPIPIIRGEIRFPKLSGYIGSHFYAAQEVKVVIDVEPKAPPMAKNPETMSRDLIYRETPPVPSQASSRSAAWKLIGDGAMIVSITILTDFIFGIGIADDAVTIPWGLSLVGTGIARLMFPVVVRQATLYSARRMAYVSVGMTLKAAH